MSKEKFLSYTGVSRLMRKSAPGAFSPESIQAVAELAEEHVKKITSAARKIADQSGKKILTKEHIKTAQELLWM